MPIAEWGVIARSRSTQIQLRKSLAEAYTSSDEALTAAEQFAGELNQQAKFGLTDWIGQQDALVGGPHEVNPNPAEAAPVVTPSGLHITAGGVVGMNGRIS